MRMLVGILFIVMATGCASHSEVVRKRTERAHTEIQSQNAIVKKAADGSDLCPPKRR